MEKIMWPCSRVGAVRMSSAVTWLGLDGYDLHSSLGMWYRDKVRPRLSNETVRTGRQREREEGGRRDLVVVWNMVPWLTQTTGGESVVNVFLRLLHNVGTGSARAAFWNRSSKLVWEYFGEPVPFKERPQTSSTYHGAFHLIWIARAQTNLKAQRNLMVIAKKCNTAA